MFCICSRPLPPSLMPGSSVLGFAPSGRRRVVFFAGAPDEGPVLVLGAQAATARTTNSDSAMSFLIPLPAGGSPLPRRSDRIAAEGKRFGRRTTSGGRGGHCPRSGCPHAGRLPPGPFRSVRPRRLHLHRLRL